MKKLIKPVQNDIAHLKTLANNHKLAAVNPTLKNNEASIASQYFHYEHQNGNACTITPIVMSQKLKDSLIYSYENRSKYELKFIENMRDTHDEVCSMCGGKFPWSLDHILPKADYPEWAIFSKNLVPACRCNIRRGSALKGPPGTNSRIIHPYYDTIFETRQLSCTITSNNNFRWINVVIIYLQPTHPDIQSIKFHVEKIVMRSGIEKYITRTLWNKLTNKPGLAIRSLYEKNNLTEAEVTQNIEQDLRWFDERTGTPNNWDSIFLHGILHSPGVVSFITEKHNQTI
jgi:5-methylcytosine-specific restriction endonuclease McrA